MIGKEGDVHKDKKVSLLAFYFLILLLLLLWSLPWCSSIFRINEYNILLTHSRWTSKIVLGVKGNRKGKVTYSLRMKWRLQHLEKKKNPCVGYFEDKNSSTYIFYLPLVRLQKLPPLCTFSEIETHANIKCVPTLKRKWDRSPPWL